MDACTRENVWTKLQAIESLKIEASDSERVGSKIFIRGTKRENDWKRGPILIIGVLEGVVMILMEIFVKILTSVIFMNDEGKDVNLCRATRKSYYSAVYYLIRLTDERE